MIAFGGKCRIDDPHGGLGNQAAFSVCALRDGENHICESYFLCSDRDLLSLFSGGVRILYTPAKVDIHPRTPLGGKIKKY